MAGILLDGCDPPCLLAAYAVLRQQPYTPGPQRRWRYQPERMVAGPVTDDWLGRKLAPQPSLERRLGPLRAALVANRHWLVLYLDPGSRGPGTEYPASKSCSVTNLEQPRRAAGYGVTASRRLSVL